MDSQEIVHILETTGALQDGHFELTSGLHSPTYFQCALMLQYPAHLERTCRDIVEFYSEESDSIDVVVAPAVGGIVVAQEVGRQLGARCMFAERVGEKMALRRGFHISPKENVLILEDVVTTGETVQELVKLTEAAGGFVVGIGCIVDRSGGSISLDVPLYAVHTTKVITYPPDNCPLCRQKVPMSKPGSRNLRKA